MALWWLPYTWWALTSCLLCSSKGYHNSTCPCWRMLTSVIFLFSIASKKSKYEDVIDLIICADLSCLSVFIREKNHRIAEIHIEGRNKTLIAKVQNFLTVIVYRFCMSCFWGLDSQVIMKKAATDMTAKLKNIIIVDSDETALYKKVGICMYRWFFLNGC